MAVIDLNTRKTKRALNFLLHHYDQSPEADPIADCLEAFDTSDPVQLEALKLALSTYPFDPQDKLRAKEILNAISK